jgi:hypothetical protein
MVGFSPPNAGLVECAAAQLLDRGFVVARRRAKDARGVAQQGVRHELGVVADAGAVDQQAERVGALVAVKARQHRRRHRQADELGTQQMRGQLDRRYRI